MGLAQPKLLFDYPLYRLLEDINKYFDSIPDEFKKDSLDKFKSVLQYRKQINIEIPDIFAEQIFQT